MKYSCFCFCVWSCLIYKYLFGNKQKLHKWRLYKNTHLEQINNERLYQLVLELIAIAGKKHLVFYVDRMDQDKCRLPSDYRYVQFVTYYLYILHLLFN